MDEILGCDLTCDQAFFFFQGRTRRERHIGIIGSGHDLRLGVTIQVKLPWAIYFCGFYQKKFAMDFFANMSTRVKYYFDIVRQRLRQGLYTSACMKTIF